MKDTPDRRLSAGCMLWLIGIPLFLVFLGVDTLWGVQLGLRNPPGWEPDMHTPAPSRPAYTPWPMVARSPWTPRPRYTGPGSLCRDGWVSHSTGRGTCSHHGGIG